MAYVEREVAPGVVVWTSTGSVGAQRILPDGCLDLILDGDRLLVAGPDPTARVHVNDAPRPMTAVRLHAGRGPALLGVPADELTGRTVPLGAVWGDRRTRPLTERVLDDPTAALGEWAVGVEADPFGFRLRALLAGGGTVTEAADVLGWSSRQLHRRTRAAFGYGPQHLARVLRLERAVALADAGTSWASVAASAGFTDQAHLARDVRALTGTTPTRLRAERVRSVQDAA